MGQQRAFSSSLIYSYNPWGPKHYVIFIVSEGYKKRMDTDMEPSQYSSVLLPLVIPSTLLLSFLLTLSLLFWLSLACVSIMFVPVNVKVYFAMYYGVVILLVVVTLRIHSRYNCYTLYNISCLLRTHKTKKRKKEKKKSEK